MTTFEMVMADVGLERLAQIKQWGGNLTDDTRNVDDWFKYIGYQMDRARYAQGGKREVRERLIKITALAVAAVESLDRKEKGDGDV